MSRETELLEAILQNQQEILIAMSLTSDAITAQTTAVTALTAAVAAIPNDSATSADDAANAQAIEANTTAITAATTALTSDVAPPPSTLAFAPQSVTAAVGSALNNSLAATGGTPPYSFTSPNLPAGVDLSTEGVLTGTAPAAGTYDISVNVTDSSATPETASGSVTLTTA